MNAPQEIADVLAEVVPAVVNMQHTPGVTLADCATPSNWGQISRARRDPIIRALARRFPHLFGCQHIIHAIPA